LPSVSTTLFPPRSYDINSHDINGDTNLEHSPENPSDAWNRKPGFILFPKQKNNLNAEIPKFS
jgi:hypothetical protein